MDESVSSIQQSLAGSLGFTEDEVALNGTGRLSERQEAMVASEQRRSKKWSRIAGVVIMLSIGVVGLIALVSADASGAALGAFGVVVVIVVALFVLSIVIGRIRSEDLRNRRITTVSGTARTKIKKTTSELGGVTLYKLKIGKTKFQLSNKAQLAAFDTGATYTVHYLKAPGTPLILSATAS